MFFETIPYIIVFLIGILNLCINTKKSNDLFYLLLFVFSALRCDVGFDYMGYRDSIISGDDFAINRMEYAERYLAIISHDSFCQLFFIVNSFITIYFTKWGFERYNVNLGIAALIFLCFPNMYLLSLGIVRFWAGLSILFYGSSFLKEKKYVVFIIFLIISLLFHKSLIIGVLLIPFFLIEIPYWFNFVILALGFMGGEFILTQILSGIMPDSQETATLVHYVMSDGEKGMTKVPYFYLGINLYCLFFTRWIWDVCRENRIIMSVFTLGTAMMFLFSFQTTLAQRFSLPFLVFGIIIISRIVLTFKQNLKRYQLQYIVFNILCFSLLLYSITIFNDYLGRSQYLPYKLFFL